MLDKQSKSGSTALHMATEQGKVGVIELLLSLGADRALRDSIGHVTSVCFSPALGKYIALALVKGGKARHGTRAFISDPIRKRYGAVEIVSHHFFDPDGSRMHG